MKDWRVQFGGVQKTRVYVSYINDIGCPISNQGQRHDEKWGVCEWIPIRIHKKTHVTSQEWFRQVGIRGFSGRNSDKEPLILCFQMHSFWVLIGANTKLMV